VSRGSEVRNAGGWLTCLLLLGIASLSAQQEVIVAVNVHGNTLTSAEEIVRASGLAEGVAFSDHLLTEARNRLSAFKQFHSVETLKRYASISDPTQIIVVIQVDEGPVQLVPPGIPGQSPPGVPGTTPSVVKRRRFNVMFVPVLDAEDGYGLTYGVQFAVTEYRNTTRRLLIPLTWGGDKRAAIELHKELSVRFAPDVRIGAIAQRRTHPFFDSNADRARLFGRSEWQLARGVRGGGEIAWQASKLVGEEENTKSIGADLIVDTRVDPLLPHNAIYVRGAVERLKFSDDAAVRTELDANAYIGLYRGTLLAIRGLHFDISRPAPAYFKSILGGSRNLRGFRAGHSIGDTLVAGSAELRIPFTSPLRLARFGTNIFVDVGTAYDKGQRFGDQAVKKGVGGGIWATAPLFQVNLMVARGIGSDTRVHFGAGVSF
jgi:outer membrane protein assembly factor BamA